MLKREEATKNGTCWNSALEDEMVFVLLARDASAPIAIRAWAQHRMTTRKNSSSDDIICEAMNCADYMDAQRDSIRQKLGKHPSSDLEILRASHAAHEVRRLAGVVEGYIERHGSPPTDATKQLVEMARRLVDS